MNNRLNLEEEATRSLMELLEKAKEAKRLHDRALMAYPEPLKRVLGMNGLAGSKSVVPFIIPPPERSETPPEVESDWISIKTKDATPTSVVLASLRGAKEPVRAKDVIAHVMKILPNVPTGSIANIGSRLDGKLIRRTKEGWELTKLESAGVLHRDLIWGPYTIFSKIEMAAHRRDAIIHVLPYFQSGLQTGQILDQLKNCSWVRAPINKELVQDDMEHLSKQKKVRRRGHSRKWEVVPGH